MWLCGEGAVEVHINHVVVMQKCTIRLMLGIDEIDHVNYTSCI